MTLAALLGGCSSPSPTPALLPGASAAAPETPTFEAYATASASPSAAIPSLSATPASGAPATPSGAPTTPSGVPATPSGAPVTARPTLEPRPTPPEGSFVPVLVVESGFTATHNEADDYASYAAVLTNPNAQWAVYRMRVLVNLLDGSGMFLAGDERQVTVLPGQTTAIAGQVYGAGLASGLEIVAEDDATPYVPFASSGAVHVVDLQTRDEEFGRTTSGSLSSTLTSDQTFLELTVVYRDAAGTVLGGASGAVELLPSGASTPFEIVDSQPPDGVAGVEVFWLLGGALP